jgi:hypothetical protein
VSDFVDRILMAFSSQNVNHYTRGERLNIDVNVATHLYGVLYQYEKLRRWERAREIPSLKDLALAKVPRKVARDEVHRALRLTGGRKKRLQQIPQRAQEYQPSTARSYRQLAQRAGYELTL